MTPNPYRTRDRRQSPRIDTLGVVWARFDAEDTDLDVPDMSPGGCSLIVPAAIEVGSKHQIDFSAQRRVQARLLVEVVSCRVLQTGRFQVGCRFVNAEHPRVQAKSGALLDAVMDIRFDISEVE